MLRYASCDGGWRVIDPWPLPTGYPIGTSAAVAQSAGIPSTSFTSSSRQAVQCRERAAETLRHTGQHRVLHRRVDRPTTDDADTVELGVGDRHHRRVGAEQQECRRFIEVFGEVVARRSDPLPRGQLFRGKAGHHLHESGRILLPLGLVDVLDGTFLVGVRDHHDTPRLCVAARRRPARCLQHSLEYVVRYRIGPQLADGTQGAHRFVEPGSGRRVVAHPTSVAHARHRPFSECPRRTRTACSPCRRPAGRQVVRSRPI